MGGQVRWNVAAFINKYRDLQSAITMQGAVRAENITTNIAKAKTQGIESELTWLPMEGLQIGFNVGYLDAKFTDFCADINGVFTDGSAEPGQCDVAEEIIVGGVGTGTFTVPIDNSGQTLANAPKWNGSISVDYSTDVGVGIAAAHLDWRYTNRYNTWGRSENEAFYRDEVVLMNGHIELAQQEDLWSLRVYGRNLLDKTVMSGAIAAGANPIIQYYQPRREIGAELSFNF